MNTPAEIREIWVANGMKKADLPAYKMILLGILAGVYIGLGAHAFLIATSAGETGFEIMLAKLIGAGLFPVGLMLVIFCGAELFTGNNLLTLALLDKKITVGAMLKNWIIVYAANLAGGIILAQLLAKSGIYAGAAGERAIAVAVSKTETSFTELLIRGILCNMLVVLACWFQAGAKSMAGKIFAVWFPIMLFVFAGFEHSVANMYYITGGLFAKAVPAYAAAALEAGIDLSALTWGSFLLGNLLPVTLGNLIGGCAVGAAYWFCYLRKQK